MTTIVTRAGKGSPLTWNEVDANFTNLNSAKYESGNNATLGTVNVNVNSASTALTVTQTGTGNAFVVEDSASPDSTPFVIDANGNVGIGKAPSVNLDVVGDAYFGAKVHTGNGLTTGTAAIELGGLRTGDGLSLIDFHSTSGSDYETRLLKTGGANGNFQIINTGTGDLQLSQTNAGPITFQTTNTERMRIDSVGNVGIGGVAEPATKLQITGTLPSSSANSLPVLVSGTLTSSTTGSAQIYRSSPSTQASAFTLAGLNHFYAAQGTIGAGSAITNQSGFIVENSLIGATNNYGFRGSIPSGTGRYNLYMDGTANNYLAGKLGIGTITLTQFGLRVSLPITGNAGSYGIRADGQVQSDVGVAAYYFNSTASTVASAFTLSELRHYTADQGTFGAGSTVTSQFGFISQFSLISAANNYSFFGNIPSGTGRYNLYMAGTADNYLSGNLGIGTASPQYKFHVSGAEAGGAVWATTVNTDATVSSKAGYLGVASGTNNYFSLSQTVGGATTLTNAGAGTLSIVTAQATPIIFYTTNTERMRIDAIGNVGIGTTSPTTRLHARSDSDALHVIGQIQNRNGGANTGGIIAFLNSTTDIVDSRYAYIGALTTGAGQTGNNLVFGTNINGASPAERMRIDSSGNVLVKSPAGLGYGTGAGGTVTQATSKSTAVTLNKPTGQITMSNAALGANTQVQFTLNNSLIAATDNVITTLAFNGSYDVRVIAIGAGAVTFALRNLTAGSLSDAVGLNFSVIKGSAS